MTAREQLTAPGALLRFAVALALVYATFNPEGVSYYVLSLGTTRAVGHVALVVIALLLGVVMSWSHVTRRLTGQVDTDEVA
ncbi:MAG: DUF6524 family protein [Gemmatimonadales bacterium]